MMGTLSLNLPCFIVEASFGGRRRWIRHGKMSSGQNRTGKGEGTVQA